MKIWDVVLPELSAMSKTLASVQTIMNEHHRDKVFCEEYLNNQVVETTYGELFKSAQDVANYIINDYGKPRKDEVIFLQSRNSKNWVICFWGILQSGYIPVLVDPETNKEHFKYIREKLKPKFTIDDGNISNVVKFKSTKNQKTTFANSFILLTSGTTDMPKIVEFNGECVYAQILLAKDIITQNKLISNYGEVDSIKMLMFLPLHHVFGLMANYMWFTFFGVRFVFINSINPDEIQFACRRHSVTHFLGVPMVWETVAKKIWLEADRQDKRKALIRGIRLTNFLQTIFPRFGLWLTKKIFKNVRKQALGDSLNFTITGGASIEMGTLKLMNGLGYALHHGYGMTETGIVSVELSKRASKRNLTSVGKPFRTMNWRINNDGILELNGVMLSHKIVEKNQTIEMAPNKWFATKDVFVNKHGRLSILGRSDDIIVSLDGTKINPEEIENQFKFDSHLHSTVIPFRQGSGYDKIVLIIGIPTDMNKSLQNEIVYRTFEIIKSLPISKRPREAYFTNELPLTNLGKVKRNLIKQSFIKSPKLFTKIENKINIDQIKQQYSKELNGIIGLVKKCYAEVLNLKINQINEHTDFILDLGGTSMDYYNLINKISIVIGKEVSLVDSKTLTTPLDFALLLSKKP